MIIIVSAILGAVYLGCFSEMAGRQKISFSFWRGFGDWGRGKKVWGLGKRGKVSQNDVFVFTEGNSMTIRFWKMRQFHCRKFLLSSGVAPANQTKESEVCELPGKESGTGFRNPLLLQNPPKRGVPEQILDSFPESSRTSLSLVNFFLIKLVSISGFSSLFSAVAKCAESTAIARKRQKNPEILTSLTEAKVNKLFGLVCRSHS